MPQDPQIAIPQMRLPKGGGAIKGIGETFQPSPFTGTASFSVTIEAPEARGLAPDLQLEYSSGGAQGPFGLGFSFSAPNIARRTEKRLPDYSDADEFVLSDAEYLVPVAAPDRKDGDYLVRRFRTRTEGDFLRVERWTHTDGETHWRVLSPDGITRLYGRTPASRISNPDDAHQVFCWLLDETRDALGNKIRYTYKAEDGDGLPARRSQTQQYLHQIEYGNYVDAQNQEQFAFCVAFDYGDYGPIDLSDPRGLSSAPTASWTPRADPFSDYRAGFEIRTSRLCRHILVFHRFAQLGQELGAPECLARIVELEYDENPRLSLLREIRQVAYRRQPGGRYEAQALPPLRFGYSPFKPLEQGFQPLAEGFWYQPLTVAQQGPLAQPLGGAGFQLLDLNAEGLPGLLYDRPGVKQYWRPAGDGAYLRPLAPEQFPIEGAGEPDYDLADGAATRLTVRADGRAGSYRLLEKDRWSIFEPLDFVPLEFTRDGVELEDVTGDGLPDLLVFDDEQVRVYPAIGARGHGPAVLAPRRPDMPLQTRGAADELQLFADMSGDGLSDRVRIRDGQVTYWPNLGWGRFGAPIAMAGAPQLADGLDPARVFLADLDGSGASDLICIEHDEVVVYFNESGNRFAETPLRIPLPAPWHQLANVQFADVRGNGTACLVFSYGTQELRHEFYDFAGGDKPYMLAEVDNRMGAVTRVRYAASTRFYLADRAAGRPWLTQLPFPVQVVEQIETVDQIAGSKQISSYSYHHGAFDQREREFAGFGLVERRDDEGFEQFGADRAFALADGTPRAAAIFVKTWYHTGVLEREQPLSRQFAEEYYALDGDALVMDDSALDGVAGDPASAQEAYRALRGKVLREETYGVDEQGAPRAHPYTVEESSYILRLEQPIGDQPYSVYLPLLREQIAYSYEQQPADPRVIHQLYLAYDAKGNPTREAELAYGRRDPSAGYDDQNRARGRYTFRRFLNIGPEDTPAGPDAYRLGIPVEVQTFELSGLAPDRGRYYGWEAFRQQFCPDAAGQGFAPELAAADFHQPQPPSTGSGQSGGRGARRIGWERSFYWDDAYATGESSRPLALGEAGPRALLRRVETAAHTLEGVRLALTQPENGGLAPSKHIDVRDILTTTELSDGGALVIPDGSGADSRYLWDTGVAAIYGGADNFFQPVRFEDQWETPTMVAYDEYQLVLQQTEAVLDGDAGISHIWRATRIDYQAMQPRQVVDINGNTTDYAYDPMGNLRAFSRYRLDAKGAIVAGDRPLDPAAPPPALSFAALQSADPAPAAIAAMLGQASGMYFYDPLAWHREGEPAYAASVRRERYLSDGGANTALQIELEYTDGLGRSVQKKQRAEGGPALIVRDDDTAGELPNASVRWLTSGRTVYNSKGLIVKQYEPFYADTPRYQPERAITERGVTAVRSYDPLGRAVRVDLPTGYYSRTEFEAWRTLDFDANDTDASGPFVDTPTEQWLDIWGRAFLIVEHQRPRTLPPGWQNAWGKFFADKGMSTTAGPLRTYSRLDIDGNPTGIKDARLFAGNPTSTSGPWSFETSYDMQGRPVRQIGADSGVRWTLYNASGDEIQRWDARGIQISTEYDSFGRPIGIFATDLSARNPQRRQAERIDYGEYESAAAANQLRGQVVAHYDGAGLMRFDRYSLDGEWLTRSRRIWSDIHKDPDYTRDADPDGETLKESRTVDALGRIVTRSYPDGRVAQHEYHPSGRLRRLALVDGRTVAASAEAISYNARGQRESIRYGNGVVTTYSYDPRTFYLVGQITTGPSGGATRTLQQLRYSYDPVGNISSAEDAAQDVVFKNNNQVLPRADYAYDALYRLAWASGREQIGLYGAGRPKRPGDALVLPQTGGPNDGTALRSYAEFYTYDDAGNLVTIRHTTPRHDGDFTVALAVDAASNRAVPDNRPPGSQQALDTRAAYDAAGNMLRLDHLQALGWDARGRLASATIIPRAGDTADAEYYRYDGDGQRVRKVRERKIGTGGVQSEETIYLDGYEVRLVYNGANRANPLERYASVHLADDQGHFVTAHRWDAPRGAPAPQARYQIGNHQGSVGLELSERGEIISYEEYYPYGGTALIAGRSQTEVRRKVFGYTGRERDNATSMYYFGARYYAPWLARWISPDPAGPIDGPNLFTYVRGNPLRFVDDGGLARTTISSQKAWDEFNRANISTKSLALARLQVSFRGRPPMSASAPARPALPAPGDDAGASRALSPVSAPARAAGDRGPGGKLSIKVLESKVATQSTVKVGAHTYTVLTKATTGPFSADIAVVKTKAGIKATPAQIAKNTRTFKLTGDPGRSIEGKLRKLREEYQKKIDKKPIDESAEFTISGDVYDKRFALIRAIDTYFNMRDLPGAFGVQNAFGPDAGEQGPGEASAAIEDGPRIEELEDDGGNDNADDGGGQADEAREHRHDD